MKKLVLSLVLLISSYSLYSQVTDTGDKVGIGTNNPSEKLHVSGNLLLHSFSTGIGERGIFFREGFNSTNKYNMSILSYDHNGSHSDGLSINGFDGVSFSTGSNNRNERMRIALNGNVGIGTTNPLEAFQIGDRWTFHNGGHKIIGYNYDFDGGEKRITNDEASVIRMTSEGDIRFLTSDYGTAGSSIGWTNTLILKNDGKVGIGTLNPEEKLHVDGNIRSKYLRLEAVSNAEGGELRLDGPTGKNPWFVDNFNGDFRLHHSGSTFMRVKSNGNIGVGTTNPQANLHIRSNDFKDFIVLDRTGRPEVENIFHITPSWDGNQNDQLQILAGGQFLVAFEETGNVGFGTNNPAATLHIAGNNSSSSPLVRLHDHTGGTNSIDIDWDSNQNFGYIRANGNKDFVLQHGTSGAVGIGTTTTGTHKLAVEGSIGARELLLEAGEWSDFVFAKDYELQSLEEVEDFIQKNQHLPEVPSEAEVLENGINVGEMDATLLQKIEELTLYMIEMNKRVKKLEQENKELKEQLKD